MKRESGQATKKALKKGGFICKRFHKNLTTFYCFKKFGIIYEKYINSLISMIYKVFKTFQILLSIIHFSEF